MFTIRPLRLTQARLIMSARLSVCPNVSTKELLIGFDEIWYMRYITGEWRKMAGEAMGRKRAEAP
jgi:hypothetical protein